MPIEVPRHRGSPGSHTHQPRASSPGPVRHLQDGCSGCSGGCSPQPRPLLDSPSTLPSVQAVSLPALSSITCSEGQAPDATWSRCHWAPWASLTLASQEDKEQNHLSLIGLEAAKTTGARGEQAPRESAGTTSRDQRARPGLPAATRGFTSQTETLPPTLTHLPASLSSPTRVL